MADETKSKDTDRNHAGGDVTESSDLQIITTTVPLLEISSDCSGRNCSANDTIDFDKCKAKDGNENCTCFKCKDFVVLDDTGFEKIDKKDEVFEHTLLFTTSDSFLTSTPCKNSSKSLEEHVENDRKVEDKSQPPPVQMDANLKQNNDEQCIHQKSTKTVEAVNDKNTETDSLIITTDDMELENEVDIKAKKVKCTKKSIANETQVKDSATKKVEIFDKEETEMKPNSSKQTKEKPDNAAKTASTRFILWVSNINRTIKASDLKRHFSKFGKVVAAKIVTDGKRCFGYITLQKSQDVDNCVKYLNNTYFEGKKISVSTAPPEKNFEKENPDAPKSTTSDTDKKCKEITKKRIAKEDPLTTVFPINKATEKRPKPVPVCSHEKLQKEVERMKRRLHEEEQNIREERARQKLKDEAQREMDFKLKQERHKLKMERELFEKERHEVFRLDQERRKLEEEKLEILRYKSKVEEELRMKKRKLNSEFCRSRSEEKQKSVKSKVSETHAVSKPASTYGSKSRLRSRSRSRVKIEDVHYSREREEGSKHFMRAPPAPKLSDLERSKHQYQDRYSDEKKYYPEKRSPDRKYEDYRSYSNKKVVSERRHLKSHRDGKSSSSGDRFNIVSYEMASCEQWKPSVGPPPLQKISDGWSQISSIEPWKVSGSNVPDFPTTGGRYQDSSFPFQFSGSSRNWCPPPIGTDFSRYEHYGQPSLTRKY